MGFVHKKPFEGSNARRTQSLLNILLIWIVSKAPDIGEDVKEYIDLLKLSSTNCWDGECNS
jgi:hypothetical protein